MRNKEHCLFNGFSVKTLNFLRKLRANNNKAWFEENKSEYQKFLLEPLRNLAMDLSENMLMLDNFLVIGPKAVSRIYRDTRFSKNKAPYKTTMWLTFKRPLKDWVDMPTYFFEISPDSYRYGMGFYSATPKTMKKFRELIDKKPKEFKKAISFYPKQKTFVLEGEKYRKIFDETKSAEIQDWYQRKNFYLVCNREIDDTLFSKKLTDDLISGFGSLAEFYYFLLKNKG